MPSDLLRCLPVFVVFFFSDECPQQLRTHFGKTFSAERFVQVGDFGLSMFCYLFCSEGLHVPECVWPCSSFFFAWDKPAVQCARIC